MQRDIKTRVAVLDRAVALCVSCLGCVALLAGCSGARDLVATDSFAPVYNARAVKRFSGDTGGSGIELEYGTVHGRDTEFINPGETVTLGDGTVNGPVDLRNEVRVQNVHLAFNYLHFANRPVELEWFVGLGGVRMAWTAQPIASAQPALSKRMQWLGATAGAGARWKIAPWVALEGRLSAGAFGANAIGTRSTAEIGLVFKPAPQVGVRVGYAQSTTEVERTDFDSRMTFNARGPYLGLGLVF